MAELNHEGRDALFVAMMERFDEIRARYRGVRGELLEKVREEMMTLDPRLGGAPVASAAVEKGPEAPAVEKAPAISASAVKTPVASAAVERAPAMSAAVEKAPVMSASAVKTPVASAAVERAPAMSAAVEKAPAVSASTVNTPVASAAATALAANAPAAVTRIPGRPDMRPSCRSCGRSMTEREDGTLVCQNGHVRLLAS